MTLPAPTGVPDHTPTGLLTPETYLGYEHGLANYVGLPVTRDRFARYAQPAHLPDSRVAYAGRWKVGPEQIASGGRASILLHFYARDVYLVAGGKGRVRVLLDGRPHGAIRVDGFRLYTAVDGKSKLRNGTLDLRFPPGIDAYSFTFG